MSLHDRHHARAQILHALWSVIRAALTPLVLIFIVHLSQLVRLETLDLVLLLTGRLLLHLLLADDIFECTHHRRQAVDLKHVYDPLGR
jgi:hypothetical protein